MRWAMSSIGVAVSPLRPPSHPPPLFLAEGARQRALPRPRLRLRPSGRGVHLESRQPLLPRAPLSPVNGPRSVPETGHPEKRKLALSPLEGGAPITTVLFSATKTSVKEHFFPSPDVTARVLPLRNALPCGSQILRASPVAQERWGDGLPSLSPPAPSPESGCGARANRSPPAFPRDPRASRISTPTPRCPTAGTSAIVAMTPLARALPAWLARASPSRWLIRTIRLGYAIQFAKRPPKFTGVYFSRVNPLSAPVLREEIAALLAKGAIEPVPPAEMESGFYSPSFIVPKKTGGSRPILDLRVLNRCLHKLPFRRLTQRRILQCVRPRDWFAAIDLKDAYFHVSTLPRHRQFLRFAFRGSSVAVQGPPLRALSVSVGLHQTRGGCPSA